MGMDMPSNIDSMTMKEVKDWVAKAQEKIDAKKEESAKICWNEIGKVCKKYNCKVKPVVKLNEMEDGYYTFYADLVVIALESPDEQSDEQPNDGKSGEKSDDAIEAEKRESNGEENNEVREG